MGRRRVDLQTAAQLLGISSDAVRKRAKRGNIDYVTGADGKLYVWVDTGETEDYPSSEGTFPTEHGLHHVHNELVEELRERVRFLERQVEEEREANRENRRLLAAALERIPPQIEALREEREVPESASEEPTSTSQE